MTAATEQRFQQTRHGFVKLSAIFRDTSGWRIVRTGEVPTAIVSRVYGIDTFAAVSSNELDGLDGIIVGGRYGPNPSGVLTLDTTPAYAVGVTRQSVFVNLAGQSAVGAATSPVDLSIYQKISEKGQANGYAPLDPTKQVPYVNLPMKYGTALLDFGTTPTSEGSVAVIGQSTILATSCPQAWFTGRASLDNTAEEHAQAQAFIRLSCSAPTAGTGFTISAFCLIGEVAGTFYVDWSWG